MTRPEARLPRGFRDIGGEEVRAIARMVSAVTGVYDAYGFEAVETPLVEYTEALGKFLPDEDRPNQGVFSFQDDDESWLSLRYDLTAPLARHVAEHYDRLPKPFRSWRAGYVFRNEKPGPGRFRQFMQIDADTVGTASVAADAEIAMMAADCMEAVGISRGDYAIRVNNRKVLDGVMEVIGLAGEANVGRRLTVLRAVDKLDRLGAGGVRALLGEGRKDESGDFTKGAGLASAQVETVLAFVGAGGGGAAEVLSRLEGLVAASDIGRDGVAELRTIAELVDAAGYGDGRVSIEPSVVRGLEYYTGPVFEAELTFETMDEEGRPVRFGSVGGGGRYDGLVGRFRAEDVPATGFSVGASRLYAALSALGRVQEGTRSGPVIVLVMDRERIADYQRMTAELRQAGIRAEMYLGTSGMRAQMKYADRRGAVCVVIQGEDERAAGEVMVKDLIEGARAAETIADNETWRAERPAQIAAPRDKLVETVAAILERHGAGARV